MEGGSVRHAFAFKWGAVGMTGATGGHRQWLLDTHGARTLPPVRHNELMYMRVDDLNGSLCLPSGIPNSTLLTPPFVTNEHVLTQTVFSGPKHAVAYKQFQLLPPIPMDWDTVTNDQSYQKGSVNEILEHECRSGDKIKIRNNYIKLNFNVNPDLDRHLPSAQDSVSTDGTTAIPIVTSSHNIVTNTEQVSTVGHTGYATTTTWPSYSVDKKEWYVDVRIIMAQRPLCDYKNFGFNDILKTDHIIDRYSYINPSNNQKEYTPYTTQEKIAMSLFNAPYTDKDINEPGHEHNRDRKILRDEKFRIDWRGRHKTTSKIYNLMKGKVLHFSKDYGLTQPITEQANYNIKDQYCFFVMIHTHNCEVTCEMNQVLTFDK